MSFARTGTWAVIGIWIFVILISCAIAQAPVITKTWTFILPHGTLKINLQAYPDGTSSLGIGPGQQGREAPVGEQIVPLKQILAEMPGLGADPHKLTSIGFHIFPDDVTEKLAYACADSTECRFNIKSPEKEEVRVLIALLNKSEAFEPYNEAFKQYGIRAQVTAAEKVNLIRLSTVPPRNSRDREKGKMLVLGDAMIGMRFSQIDSTAN